MKLMEQVQQVLRVRHYAREVLRMDWWRRRSGEDDSRTGSGRVAFPGSFRRILSEGRIGRTSERAYP